MPEILEKATRCQCEAVEMTLLLVLSYKGRNQIAAGQRVSVGWAWQSAPGFFLCPLCKSQPHPSSPHSPHPHSNAPSLCSAPNSLLPEKWVLQLPDTQFWEGRGAALPATHTLAGKSRECMCGPTRQCGCSFDHQVLKSWGMLVWGCLCVCLCVCVLVCMYKDLCLPQDKFRS